MLSKIIKDWKLNTFKFKKENVLLNKYDYYHHLILRDYKSFNIKIKNKNRINEYVIWCNEETIKRIIKSKIYLLMVHFTILKNLLNY